MKRTRAELGDTVAALQHRLAPREIMHRTANSMREGAAELARRGTQIVRENPGPFVAAGVGLAVLLLARSRRNAPRGRKADRELFGVSKRQKKYTFEAIEDLDEDVGEDEFEELGDYVGDCEDLEEGEEPYMDLGSYGERRRPEGMMEQAREAARRERKNVRKATSKFGRRARRIARRASSRVQKAGSHTMERMHEMRVRAKQRMHNVTTRARDTASNISHRVQERAQRAGDWFSDMFEEYPIAVGAACFALGLVGGLSIPSTRQENRMLGGMRDRLMKTAREKGSDYLERGKEVAGRAVEAASEAVREETQGSESGGDEQQREQHDQGQKESAQTPQSQSPDQPL